MNNLSKIQNVIKDLGSEAPIDDIVREISRRYHIVNDSHLYYAIKYTMDLNHELRLPTGIPSLEEQLHKTGLDNPDNWKGDIRDRLLLLLEPLVNGTDFTIKMNTTDTTSQVLDLFYKDDARRSMGFGKTKDRNFRVFPVKSFYEENKDKIEFLSIDPKKKQIHMDMTLEQFWNSLYRITRKKL
jgi:hypothetical protein